MFALYEHYEMMHTLLYLEDNTYSGFPLRITRSIATANSSTVSIVVIVTVRVRTVSEVFSQFLVLFALLKIWTEIK